MKFFPFCESQSEHLDRQVMQYQEEPTNTALYRSLRHTTQQLLYELPQHLHLLEEQECAQFLFFCWDTIDHYLQSFKIGRLSYVGYLSQVVRQRCRYFIYQQKDQIRKERLLIISQGYAEEDPYDAIFCAEEGLPYHRLDATSQKRSNSLPLLFERLLTNYRPNRALLGESYQSLHKAFANKTNRKRLLIVLALCPDSAHTYLLEEIAALLGADVTLLSTYLMKINELLENKRSVHHKFELISNRHFRRLLEIESALLDEPDAKKIAHLERLRRWTIRQYKARVSQIRKMEISLSHSEAGKLLDIPKGTIDSAVHYIRKLLVHHMDEMRSNDYP